jgi:hypothetical protein
MRRLSGELRTTRRKSKLKTKRNPKSAFRNPKCLKPEIVGDEMLWWIGSGLLVLWFALRFVLHQRGWVHILLLSGISVLVVQFAAYRKTRFQRISSQK